MTFSDNKDDISEPLLPYAMQTQSKPAAPSPSLRMCWLSIPRLKWISVPTVEAQGINPVSDNERTHTRITDNFTTWFSITSGILTISLGTLGVLLFGLDFRSALGCIVLANLINSIPGTFFSALGHRLGMRQIVITRYSYGYAGSQVVATINVVTALGWSILNAIQAGQLLVALSSSIPLTAAILAMSVLTALIAIFGYAVLHLFERWAWVPTWIAIVSMFAASASELTTGARSSGQYDWGAVASYATIIYSSPGVWSTNAADFTVKQSMRFDSRHIALLSYAGAVIPVIALETFGLVLATTAVSNEGGGSVWSGATDVGRLVHAATAPLGMWGKLVIAILALSTITHNVPNAYGLGLMMQNLLPTFQHWVFTLASVCVYTVLALAGSEHLQTLFQNLLPFMTYFYGPYVVILIIEHFLFRQGNVKLYPRDAWDQRRRLPSGVAALGSSFLGYAGAFLGVKQPWFTGPLARQIGEDGGDVGVPIAMAVSGAAYIFLRNMERAKDSDR